MKPPAPQRPPTKQNKRSPPRAAGGLQTAHERLPKYSKGPAIRHFYGISPGISEEVFYGIRCLSFRMTHARVARPSTTLSMTLGPRGGRERKGTPLPCFVHHSNLTTINGTCERDATPLDIPQGCWRSMSITYIAVSVSSVWLSLCEHRPKKSKGDGG